MNKAERLLDLIAYLLNAREPVSFGEIREAFPEDYGEGSDEAIARKFERDKADLLQLGVPLQYRTGDELEPEGYSIDRRRYALPPIPLAPEELALLFLAGSAALDQEGSPFAHDLVLALNKIAFAAGGQAEAAAFLPRAGLLARGAGNPRLREHLQDLHRAMVDRKSVTLSYHGFWRDADSKRKVDPYGLVNRRGTWILVGYCHLREDLRVFHVERIRGLAVNPIKPKTPDFEVPAGFTLSDHVAKESWQIRAHAPMKVRLRFAPPGADSAVAELGQAVKQVVPDGEAREVTLEATFLDGLLPTLLSHRGRAQVLEPAELRDKVRSAFARLAGEG